MVELIPHGVYLKNGKTIVNDAAGMPSADEARENTIAYRILRAHDKDGSKGKKLRVKFDAMASHDITYVGIIQTARASGLEKFPIPYAMTNCHNSLCAVGGTINEDDHIFGLSAAKKYGGIYVPANQAVIHQYVREALAGCGRMILGSDSHTRYGSLGCMGVGEGGGELVKQLLNNTWDINAPEVVLVWLEGAPKKGIGPHDVAISLVKAVFENGFVKNKVLEFAGPGVASLPTDFRNGIDVMTTETTCLSSIWITDEKVEEYYKMHERPEAYKELQPGEVAYYDSMIRIDLSKQESMIALPFHPSNAYTIHELQADPEGILKKVEEDARKRFGDKISIDLESKVKNGKAYADQAIIAGCSGGTYDNLSEAASIMKGKTIGNDYFTMSAYPQSTPVYLATTRNHIAEELLEAGVVIKPAFCGPCFGAGDVPANNGLSIRHTTRNFPNREGSKPGQGQISLVCLMDARSIAATAANGGILTPATDLDCWGDVPEYNFDKTVYDRRVYNGYNAAHEEDSLVYGPNIKDWPEMSPLTDNILLKVCSKIMDEVTTTDELIPSGETSSYRSNPLGLAEFTLSRRDPEYVGKSKAVDKLEKARTAGQKPSELDADLNGVFDAIHTISGQENVNEMETEIGSMIYAVKPGDGSAREQAASCQRVIGGLANITKEYATKRYRSNVMNWGMIPFQMVEEPEFEVGDYIYVPGAKAALDGDLKDIKAYVINADTKAVKEISLYVADMTADERKIVKAGCLINYNRARKGLK